MVSIEHVGNIESEEYKAASELILMFKNEFKDAKGHILFLSPAICFGQNVKDIDIVVIGQLEKGFSRQLNVRSKVRNNDDCGVPHCLDSKLPLLRWIRFRVLFHRAIPMKLFQL